MPSHAQHRFRFGLCGLFAVVTGCAVLFAIVRLLGAVAIAALLSTVFLAVVSFALVAIGIGLAVVLEFLMGSVEAILTKVWRPWPTRKRT